MAQHRKDPLVNNHYYHIYTRSIAGFEIFNNEEDLFRFHQLMRLCRSTDFNYRYSYFLRNSERAQLELMESFDKNTHHQVEIVAYCIMPTHIHLILKQIDDKGITKYMGKLLNSYSRYFNTKHGRTGPLWSGRFKSVLVDSDEQLSHLTRYVHLNPCSASIVDNPGEWPNSSYNEYIGSNDCNICVYKNIINMNAEEYSKFTLDRKNYQRELSHIKHLIIDNYSG